MKPGCTCLSHKEGLIISNGSKKIKKAHVFPREPCSKKMYAIFFNSGGPVVQVPCPSGHTVTGRFYKHCILKKVNEFYSKKRPSKGFYMTTPPLISVRCKSFWLLKRWVLNHPPYSPDLSLCDFFLFPRLKKMLSGNKYTSRSSFGSAIYQCLQQILKEDYLSAFRDWVKVTKMCFSEGGIRNMFDKT